MSLVEVRDVYDRLHYVDAEALRAGRRMLKTYKRDGTEALRRRPGGGATDWVPVVLRRENVCPHDRATWTPYRFPDGTRGDYCPVCAPMLEDSA